MFGSQDTSEPEETGCHGDDGTTDDEDDPLGWTEEERALVQPGLQLAKVGSHSHAHTQTDKQTDRLTDRQTGRHTDRQTGRRIPFQCPLTMPTLREGLFGTQTMPTHQCCFTTQYARW